ncbi:MAG: amidohydrolase [Paracoccus sp. (in: a-proteobacteria)]|nr:amidohydrolase [Paracoccus sp. (in: a-proteobacteria)]
MTSERSQADTILHNGTIWCGFNDGVHQALAIRDGRVLASGSDDEMLALGGTETSLIDLEGRFAMPGLNDAHLHLISTGLTMGWVDASPDAAPTLEALLDALRARASQTPKGEWVLARGYDQTKLDTGRHPQIGDLDAAVPDHPVMVTRACGHVSVFNSRAFALAGVSAETPDPEGGLIERRGGALTGMVAENAQGLLRDALPLPDEDTLIDAIERAGQHLLSLGITSCMDAAVGQISGYREIAAYRRACDEGRLPVRVWLTLLGDPGDSVVDEAYADGLVSGWGDDMLRLGAVKIFLDGSAGGRTAWMSQPYKGEPENFGVQILQDSQLNDLVADYHAKGYQLACHAIGDAAIGQLITAYEKALEADPDPDRRHRIEHCGFSTPDQHERMAAAAIYPCPQQAFIHDFGDAYLEVLGEARGLSCYPLATWDRMGFKPATGSDSPVCQPNPFPDIHAMITRETWKGTVMDASEIVPIEKALQCYTEHGAFSQKAENVKGRLVPGQLADIAVFSRNLLTAKPDEILNETSCVMTLLGGQIVYSA